MGIFPQVVTDFGQQRGILGKTLHQNVAGTIQRGTDVGDAFISIDILLSQLLGDVRRILPQCFRQGFQTRFNRDLSTRAAFLFVGQVEVFKLGFAEGGIDGVGEVVSQFSLIVNRLQNRLASLFKFTQIAKAGFQLAELGIIQAAGDLFTIACDKRHGIPFI